MSQLGYSDENLALLESEEVMDSSAYNKSSEACGYKSAATFFALISLVLVVFGVYTNADSIGTLVDMDFRIIKTAPVVDTDDVNVLTPFYVDRQSVPHSYIVQNAFYNYFFLKGKQASFTKGIYTYSINFFGEITRTDDKNNILSLGFFNPVIPNGQSSNVLNFNYGDVCNDNKDPIGGTVVIKCGPALSASSVHVTWAGCKYKFVVRTPEVCSPKDIYPYLQVLKRPYS